MINLPNWSPQRLLRESVADFNLRHPDSAALDAKSSDWPVLCRTIHKFVRHRLTDYEEQLGRCSGYKPALRETYTSLSVREGCARNNRNSVSNWPK
jgi:hypothetical protein